MDAYSEGSLLWYLAQVPDTRGAKGRRHPLPAILGLACCAILCGAQGYSAIAEWARNYDLEFLHRLGFTRFPPKMHGIRKVLKGLDVAALEGALQRWAERQLGRRVEAEPPLQAVSIDGKSCRGSFTALSKAVHLLSLVAHESGLTLAQAEVPNGGAEKTNEHKAGLKLLEQLALDGRVVTADAMFCHRDVCETILARGGHYFLFVKDNQPTLLGDIRAALASPASDAGLSPPTATHLA